MPEVNGELVIWPGIYVCTMEEPNKFGGAKHPLAQKTSVVIDHARAIEKTRWECPACGRDFETRRGSATSAGA